MARLLRDAGATVEVTYSPGPLATLDLVRAAVARGDVVVAVGGDGMLSSVAGEVAALGGTLGIVPAGRGNDFARMLGLPDDPAEVARVLLTGTSAAVDLVELALPDGRTRVVAGSAYAGVDARAAELVDRAHWLPRRLQYPYAAVRCARDVHARDVRPRPRRHRARGARRDGRGRELRLLRLGHADRARPPPSPTACSTWW